MPTYEITINLPEDSEEHSDLIKGVDKFFKKALHVKLQEYCEKTPLKDLEKLLPLQAKDNPVTKRFERVIWNHYSGLLKSAGNEGFDLDVITDLVVAAYVNNPANGTDPVQEIKKSCLLNWILKWDIEELASLYEGLFEREELQNNLHVIPLFMNKAILGNLDKKTTIETLQRFSLQGISNLVLGDYIREKFNLNFAIPVAT